MIRLSERSRFCGIRGLHSSAGVSSGSAMIAPQMMQHSANRCIIAGCDPISPSRRNSRRVSPLILIAA